MTKSICRWTVAIRIAQLALIVLTIALDFGHGIVLGESQIGFHPIYRLRQTVAIAISRLRQPPLHGYLAYQSVVDALDENGFAVFNNDKGPHLDLAGWSALLKDPARLDRALQAALDTPNDPKLPPQLIEGNEVGYADYAYLAFKIFGLHLSSFYYFYFVLLGVGCLLFLLEFRSSPFHMFLLGSYLAGLFFLQNYAQSQGDQAATIANSRLFEALSLLPAMHVFLAIWQRLPTRPLIIATVLGQSVLLAFLIDSRTTALWQIVMIAAAGLGVTLASMFSKGSGPRRPATRAWRDGWAGAVAVVVFALNVVLIHLATDARYAGALRNHVIWHEVLRGLLAPSPELQRDYLGKPLGVGQSSDQMSYDAVMYDLNQRGDRTSPIAFVVDGRIYIALERNYAAYELLARSLSLRIIRAHPLYVMGGLGEKLSQQIFEFTRQHSMGWANLRSAALISWLAGLLWLAAGGLETPAAQLRSGALATVVVMAFAATPVLVEPSNLSVGTLLTWMLAGAACAFALVIVAAKLFAPPKAAASA